MKRALVTGASRGIGAACARALAAQGFFVGVNYVRSEGKARRLAEEIGGAAIKADVADPKQVRAMFEAFGGVDVLVCNAGVALNGPVTDGDDTERRYVSEVKPSGAIACRLAAIGRAVCLETV